MAPASSNCLALTNGAPKRRWWLKGEDYAAVGAGLVQRLGVTPRAGHGLFAVDGFDAGRGRGFDHFAVLSGPRADAHHIEGFTL